MKNFELKKKTYFRRLNFLSDIFSDSLKERKVVNVNNHDE